MYSDSNTPMQDTTYGAVYSYAWSDTWKLFILLPWSKCMAAVSFTAKGTE